jgi:hypothetical protein
MIQEDGSTRSSERSIELRHDEKEHAVVQVSCRQESSPQVARRSDRREEAVVILGAGACWGAGNSGDVG